MVTTMERKLRELVSRAEDAGLVLVVQVEDDPSAFVLSPEQKLAVDAHSLTYDDGIISLTSIASAFVRGREE